MRAFWLRAGPLSGPSCTQFPGTDAAQCGPMNETEARDEVARARRATQLFFLVCGTGMGSWAPMVPFAKARLGVDEARLGLVLLGLACGATIAMPIAGMLTHR